MSRYDYNLAIIGGGAAGLVSAYIAAAAGAKCVLFEERNTGGDCLNTGCVPSKTLIRSAEAARMFARAEEFGFTGVSARTDFPAVMRRVRAAIARIAPHDSPDRYREMGADVVTARATLLDEHTLLSEGRRITARAIIIATGAAPAVPAIEGLAESGYVTSETVWDMQELPQRLVILGGGIIGCELAQAFGALGSDVSVIERGARLAGGEDEDVSAFIAAGCARDGVTVRTGCAAERIAGNAVHCRDGNGETFSVPYDTLLIASGRAPRVRGFGLEALCPETESEGVLRVNSRLQTSVPSLYACGDVIGPYRFTHAAAHQAKTAAPNALYAPFARLKIDYGNIPYAIYTAPPAARVGLNETQARKQGIDYEVSRYDFAGLDRAITEGETDGFIKYLTPPGKDAILGVTIAGHGADTLIAEAALARKYGLGLKHIMNVIHAYPTLSDAHVYVAGEWRKRHLPAWALKLSGRFHRRRRR